jgi:hypothetical protein
LRRLALQFHGDPTAVDLARILRVPGTFNYKASSKRPVLSEDPRWVM